MMKTFSYWQGNAAKSRVLAEILSLGEESVQVFDYGAGAAHGWRPILEKHPHLRLTLFEPHLPSRRKAKKNLAGTGSIVLEHFEPEHFTSSFDFIISFSVLEHVKDREQYLKNIALLLKKEGTCFLNFDDGHFRNDLRLERPASWWPSCKEALKNKVGPLLSWGRWSHLYQRPVASAELEQSLQRQGLSVRQLLYGNMGDLKRLYKKVPASEQQHFMQTWMDIEKELGEKFSTSYFPHHEMKKDSFLWEIMGSKTLVLKKEMI